MSHSSGTLLHETRTTWLWIVLPLFLLGGCMFSAFVIVFPLLMPSSASPSLASGMKIFKIAAVGLPVLGVFLVLFVPKITLYLDPVRNVVGIKRKALVWSSGKEYPFADVADVQAVLSGGDKGIPHYSLALILKSGDRVLLEGGSTSDFKKRSQTAAEIRAQLTPYLH